MSTLIEKIRNATLRMDDTSLDEDIEECIDACKKDLELNGILSEKIVDTDPLILRAIKLFCRAEFTPDEKEYYRTKDAYTALRNHLALSKDYTETEVESDGNASAEQQN